MKTDIALRKKNWNSVAKLLHQEKLVRDPAKKKLAKEIYLGDKPVTDFPNPFTQLLLAPQIDESLLNNTRDKFQGSYSLGWAKRSFMKLQENWEYSFGRNSFFGGQDSLVYECLGLGEINGFAGHEVNHGGLPSDLSEYLAINFKGVLGSLTLPDHSQRWRAAELWAARVNSTPTVMSNSGGDSWTEDVLCSIEWATRNPDHFDKNVVALATKMQQHLQSPSTPQSVADFYGKLVTDKLDRYHAFHQPGCEMTVWVKYANPELLEAAVLALNPDTRYPYSPDDVANRIYELTAPPSRNETTIRVSGEILKTFWESGLVVSDYDVVDGTTLICRLRTSLSIRQTMYAIYPLAMDASNLGEKYLSKKPVKGDGNINTAKRAEMSIVVESGDGMPFVSGHASADCPLVSVDSIPALEKLAQVAGSPAELAARMTEPKNIKLLA